MCWGDYSVKRGPGEPIKKLVRTGKILGKSYLARELIVPKILRILRYRQLDGTWRNLSRGRIFWQPSSDDQEFYCHENA